MKFYIIISLLILIAVLVGGINLIMWTHSLRIDTERNFQTFSQPFVIEPRGSGTSSPVIIKPNPGFVGTGIHTCMKFEDNICN